MSDSLRSQQVNFYGNWEDLEQFLLLAQSPMRTEKREGALQAWSEYKVGRQFQFVRGNNEGKGKLGRWDKGDYIHSLTARAIDLRGATLEDVCLGYADLRGVQFDDTRFLTRERSWFAMKGAKLQNASLRKADLTGARLMEADLRGADLSGANLAGADLTEANLAAANLRDASLRGANLQRAHIVGAHLEGADLRGSRVYGVSAWDVTVDENQDLQRDLVVTPFGQPEITVDNIEVAQFVYLLLSNPKIRGVIDTVCKKGVLILGRFIEERKAVLNSLRDELRRRDFVPMIFDFQKPDERDFTETIMTLAGLCRFIIADITNPSASPLELQAIVPNYMVPLVTIIAKDEKPFSMFQDLWNKHDWVLAPLEYSEPGRLIKVIGPAIIEPALKKHADLLSARARTIRTRSVSDYEGQ